MLTLGKSYQSANNKSMCQIFEGNNLVQLSGRKWGGNLRGQRADSLGEAGKEMAEREIPKVAGKIEQSCATWQKRAKFASFLLNTKMFSETQYSP